MKNRCWATFLIGVLLIASKAEAADKWSSVRSPNFTLVGNASEGQMRAVAVELEQFRDAFSQILTTTASSATVPITVVVFKNDETFAPFKPMVNGAPSTAAGFFHASEDAHYMTVTAGVPIPRAVFHYYAHQLSRDLPNAVPLWFTEGLAELVSNFEILNKEKQFGVGKAIPEHVELLRKTQPLPLDELFAVDRGSPQYNESSLEGVYYAESWALVNYLMVGLNAKRQAQVADYINTLTNGKSATENFQTAFKTDLKTMLGELDYYVRDKSDWPGRGVTLKDKSEIEKLLKSRSLSDAEAETYSGDLLLHQGRLAEAEAHLKRALAADAKLGATQASMGMLRYRQDNLAEAVEYLKKAVELDPKNDLSQYYYAFVLDKNSTSPLDDLDAKRDALGKAIELAPQYVPAYELLAYVNLTADIDYDGTIQILQNANKYAPGNANLRFLLAQALVKKEDFAQADKILQSLVNNGALELSLRDGARNLSNYIARVKSDEARDIEAASEDARREDEAARAENRARAEAEKNTQPAPPPKEPEKELTPAGPRPKNGELVAVTPERPRPEGPQIKGNLTLVDCRSGLTLTVRSGALTFQLHSDTPDHIQFVSYVPSVSTTISCGPAPGNGIPVVITYRPTPGGAMAGEPLVVEFVEK